MAAAALLAAGCSGRERVVAEPLDSVQAKLSAMPDEANAMPFAMQAINTDFYLESKGQELIWHFTKDGADYCRFTAQLVAAGPQKTRVLTRAKKASEAADAVAATGGKRPDHSYLCTLARIASEESVAATLEARPASTQAIFDKIKVAVAADPMAVVRMAESTMQDAARYVQDFQLCADYSSQACREFLARQDELIDESARMRPTPTPSGQPYPPPAE